MQFTPEELRLIYRCVNNVIGEYETGEHHYEPEKALLARIANEHPEATKDENEVESR